MNDSPNQPDRRAFVKQVIAGGAIAVPVVATFSLGSVLGDAQTPAFSSSITSSSSQNICQTDPGYVGPGRFAAHLTYAGNPGDLGARINGEIKFAVDGGEGDDDDHGHHDDQPHGKGKKRGPVVRTELRLTGEGNGGVVFASAALLVNSGYAAALNDGRSSFDASAVNAGFCDLDFVLNAMAAGQASVLVSLTYLGQPLNLIGPVAAVGPDFGFIALRS